MSSWVYCELLLISLLHCCFLPKFIETALAASHVIFLVDIGDVTGAKATLFFNAYNLIFKVMLYR